VLRYVSATNRDPDCDREEWVNASVVSNK